MAAQGDKFERIMERVQLLIARADHPGTPPEEADTARKMADALMFKYKIDTLSAPETGSAVEPIWTSIIISENGNLWSNFYVGIVQDIVRHSGCLMQRKMEQKVDDAGFSKWYNVAHVVGFEGDVRYVEMLVASALLAFGRALEPKVHPEESDAANALRLRQGGMERRRIALALFGQWSSENEMKAKNRKVTNLIKQEAERIGQPHLAKELLGRGNNIKTYRESYANGFYWTLSDRIRRLGIERAQSGNGALVLGNWKERLEEALYVKFPNLRPVPSRNVLPGHDDGVKSHKDCPKCHKAKSGYCRDHMWLKPSTAKGRANAYSSAGNRAGSNAARTVDLGPGGRAGIGN